jgi:hypothetical protein
MQAVIEATGAAAKPLGSRQKAASVESWWDCVTKAWAVTDAKESGIPWQRP